MVKSRYRRRFRWFGIGLALVLVPMFAGSIVRASTGDADLNQLEVGTFELTTDGTVATASFSEQLRLTADGEATVEIPSTLSDVKSGANTPKAKTNGAQLEISATSNGPQDPRDMEVSGTADLVDNYGTIKTPSGNRQLPVDTKLSYRMNDKTVTDLDAIAGESGRFEMEIVVQNRSGVVEKMTYADTTTASELDQDGFVFLPVTVGVGPIGFDNSTWANIVVDGAQTQQVGTTTVVSTSQVLYPPLMPGEMTIRISGDTTNFSLPSARINAMPGVGGDYPTSVQNTVDFGGGQSALMSTGLVAFVNNFVKLTEPPPAQALPFLAESLEEGAAEVPLLGSIFGVVSDGILANEGSLAATLGKIESTDLNKEVSATLDQLTGLFGSSNYTTPSCKPTISPSQCTLSAFQEPQLPPVGLAGADTVNAIAENPVTGATETYTRISGPAGTQGKDLVGATAGSDGSYLGSMYNWASFIGFSAGQGLDVDLDGTPDFDQFTWPNPSASTYNDSLYTTQALKTVAIPAGSLWPGSGVPSLSIPGVNPTFATPSKTFQALCNFDETIPASFPIIDLGVQGEVAVQLSTELKVTCPNLPVSNVTLKDILTNAAAPKVGKVTLNLDDVKTCVALPYQTCTPAGPAVSVVAQLDFGQIVAGNTQMGLQNILFSQPQKWELTCTQVVPPFSINLITDAVLLVLCGWDPLEPAPWSKQWDIIGKSSLFGGDSGQLCFYPTDLLVPSQRAEPVDTGPKLTCNLGVAGHLAALGGVSDAMRDTLFNSAWNFDNWWRGDPGFGLNDIGAATGPGLSQALGTIAAMDISPGVAKCPSTLSATPRVRPPKLDSTCSGVVPAESPPADILGNAEIILDAVGSANDPLFVAGQPADLLTALDVLARALSPVKGEADAIGASLGEVAAGVSEIIALLTQTAAEDSVLVGELATTQQVADLNSAQMKAGKARAAAYTPFMGPATIDDKQATTTTLFVFEMPGTES